VEVREGDAAVLAGLPDASIDYVFTDPPYGGLVQFGELNFPWEAWLDKGGSWRARELVVSAQRGLDAGRFMDRLGQALGEMVRVLRPGRHLTLAYHPREKVLAELEALAASAGLERLGRGRLELGQRSREQEQGGLPALDALLHFRKPSRRSSTARRTR
jgi:DNA modification methylase